MENIALIDDDLGETLERWMRADEDDEVFEWKVRATTREMLVFAESRRELIGSIRVDQLAEQLGFDSKKVYRLLQRGAIPGAFKLGPGRSHWYIPGDTAARFRAQGGA